MDISRKSLEMLLDLIEIKISLLAITDADDEKESRHLKNARREIIDLLNETSSKRSKKIITAYEDIPVLKQRKKRSSTLMLD